MNKFFVIGLISHQNKDELSKDDTSDFEMVGILVIGENLKNTHIRFRIFNDYESFSFSTDDGYDSSDAIFNGYI